MTDISAPSPNEAAQSTSSKRLSANFSWRRFLGFLHLWTGIIFCIPFVLIGISGSVLMIGHELPNRFVPNSASGTYKSAAEIIAAAKAVAPPDRAAVNYDVPAKPGDLAYVRFAAPPRQGQQQAGPQRPGAGTRVSVDPVTLEAKIDQSQGQAGPGQSARGFDFMRLMHDMHGRLLINGGTGRQFVGWLGVFMCGLGLTGIIMWWPRPGQWGNAFKFRLKGNALRANRETHGAFGIWSLIVFMIVSFSGVYIVFPQPINSVVNASPAIRDLRNQKPFPVQPIEGTAPADADAVADLAREAVPGGVVRAISLPANPELPYRVTLSREGDMNGKPRALVIVDPWQSKVMEVRDPDAYRTIDKFLAFQRQLHAGNGVGWWWWIPVFISGFLPALFVGTGIAMYLIKRRNKRRVAAQA
jgi:uncharacterized iron-regulated membrane protein